MSLRPADGLFRIPEPVVGRVLLSGDAPEEYDLGDRRAVAPGDYDLVGFGSLPADLRGREGEGITVGTQVCVIELDGARVVIAGSAGDPVKRESAP